MSTLSKKKEDKTLISANHGGKYLGSLK